MFGDLFKKTIEKHEIIKRKLKEQPWIVWLNGVFYLLSFDGMCGLTN
jgi:hypothetical protein